MRNIHFQTLKPMIKWSDSGKNQYSNEKKTRIRRHSIRTHLAKKALNVNRGIWNSKEVSGVDQNVYGKYALSDKNETYKVRIIWSKNKPKERRHGLGKGIRGMKKETIGSNDRLT